MALHDNKQMQIAGVKQEVAADVRCSARTKYLPHVSAVGAYIHTSKEISLLSDERKTALSNLGSTVAPGIQQLTGLDASSLAPLMNAKGQNLVDALRTDSRNIFAGSVLLTQPIYMGGAIVAANKIADLSEQLTANQTEQKRQQTIYDVDQAYWQVVSLVHKKRLAESYLRLVSQLETDISKMVSEGVATRSDLLSVSVKVNEAEMSVTKVSDGLVLSRMLLCQRIGLPVSEQIALADENDRDIFVAEETASAPNVALAMNLRPELRMLQNTIDISKQSTRLLRAGNLPQVLLTGGYAVSNPNMFNGFEKKLDGFWHVGVIARVPIWNWGDVRYKVRASKGATAIASLELEEAREKIELQVSQTRFRVDEAYKRLAMARSDIRHADENLRTANLGFKEGVISTTAVMEAQTAWLQAQSQHIDAAIDVRLSQTDLEKALGTLDINK
jgi:outer membrane protein TolC